MVGINLSTQHNITVIVIQRINIINWLRWCRV